MDQLAFEEVPASGKRSVRHLARDASGKFRGGVGPAPSSAEVATIEKAEFYSPISELEYPNLSAIVRTRSQGQGIRFYDTMEGTDADLASFFRDLVDDVLHYPFVIQAADKSAASKEQADFFKFAWQSIPNRQNVIRHFLTAYARGFSVTEKIFRVVDRGQWKGAVVYDRLLDKPQRWFTFDLQRRLRFRTSFNYIPGELVDQNKFIVLAFGTNSTPYGEALYDLCYWPWFLKHHALKNQALFMEKWASPTALAEYEWSSNEKLNKENRNKALVALQAIQNDSALATPKGMAIKLLESLRNGTVSFEGYINQLTEMESRIVTGQLLTSMGADGGSHALGKVHEKRAANKVEMLADFVGHAISRYIGRDLIDRNYGPQDVYPTFTILAKNPVSRQADAELEAKLMQNGHQISRAWSDEAFQIVAPADSSDVLTPPPATQPTQTLPVNTNLAGPADEARDDHGRWTSDESRDAAEARVSAASARLKAFPRRPDGRTPDEIRATPEWVAAKREYDHAFSALRKINEARNRGLSEPAVFLAGPALKDLHAKAKAAAVQAADIHAAVGAKASAQAKPGIAKAVKSLAGAVAKKKKASTTKKADVFKALPGADVSGLGAAMQTMLHSAPPLVTVQSALAGPVDEARDDHGRWTLNGGESYGSAEIEKLQKQIEAIMNAPARLGKAANTAHRLAIIAALEKKIEALKAKGGE